MLASIVIDSRNIPYIGSYNSYVTTVMKFTPPDPEDTSTYKWYRNGEAITGATSTTYTVASGDEGKALTFEVTPISQG